MEYMLIGRLVDPLCHWGLLHTGSCYMSILMVELAVEFIMFMIFHIRLVSHRTLDDIPLYY